MKKIALIYWPEDGNVEAVAEKIKYDLWWGNINYSISNIDKEIL